MKTFNQVVKMWQGSIVDTRTYDCKDIITSIMYFNFQEFIVIRLFFLQLSQKMERKLKNRKQGRDIDGTKFLMPLDNSRSKFNVAALYKFPWTVTFLV